MIIESTAISSDPTVRRSIAHAGNAGRACLAAAGLVASDVDLLINLGIYRDHNMAEPAMAALIQKEIGINLDYVKSDVPKAVASFDLMNGACGHLNALQVASAFMAIGSAQRILVVSSDVHPSGRLVEGFPLANVGAAMLLKRSDKSGTGFGPVRVRSGEDGFPGVEGYIRWTPTARNEIFLETHPEFAARALALAEATAREYAEVERVDLTRTYLVTSHPSRAFARDLAKRLGVKDDAVATPDAIEGDPHSSSMTWGYHQAHAAGAEGYESVLFVAVGSGMTSACAIYRR